jgi:predicted dehydrogenase
MNLTPEQKAIGRENFLGVVGTTRRDFLKKGIMAGVVSGGGLGAFYFGYEASVPSPVRVAVLGTGDEGSVLLGALNPKFIEVKAIADIRPYNQYRAFHGDCYGEVAMKARPGLMAKYGWNTEEEARKHVKVYEDYRDLLKNEKDIEAVIIALPLHLHAPAAIMAMRAGKHVLTEKLMGHTVYECKEMALVSEETKRLLATGHQRHYNILYENAKDTINRGLLGDLHFIRAQWHRGNLPGNDSWQQPLPPGIKPGDKKNNEKLAKELALWEKELQAATDPKEVAMWQKKVLQKRAQIADQILKDTAAKHGYQEYQIKDGSGKVVYTCPPAEELIRWRLWDRTGAGLMAELGSHQMDAASIFIAAQHGGKKQIPLNVMAAGNRPLFPADRDVEDHVICIIEFPAPGYNAKDPIASRKRIAVQYSSINGNGFGGYGEVVYGTGGTLILEREQEAMLFKEADTESKIGVTSTKKGPALDTQASGGAQKAAAVGAMAMQDISRGYTEEIEHWAWCIRNPAPENQPRCQPKVAIGDAIIALTANKAAREGKRIEFDPEWFDIHSKKTLEGIEPNPNDPKRYA